MVDWPPGSASTAGKLTPLDSPPPPPQVDSNDLKTPGWRYNYWELKGVPVRVEVGPKDVANNSCVTARRDQGGQRPGVHSAREWRWGKTGVGGGGGAPAQAGGARCRTVLSR